MKTLTLCLALIVVTTMGATPAIAEAPPEMMQIREAPRLVEAGQREPNASEGTSVTSIMRTFRGA